jgi:ADP-ribose pyrophosphatase
MQQWKTISKEVILECDRFLTVENHTIELPDGRIVKQWPWVVTPDFINVVAVTEDNTFLCFRQTKYAVEGTSLAPVGGYIEPGELPLDAARRELLEETGHEAKQWHFLGTFPVDANRGCGMGNFFLALGAHAASAIQKDDLEEQELLFLSRQEMDDAIAAGGFRVMSWAMSVLLALNFLDRKSEQ